MMHLKRSNSQTNQPIYSSCMITSCKCQHSTNVIQMDMFICNLQSLNIKIRNDVPGILDMIEIQLVSDSVLDFLYPNSNICIMFGIKIYVDMKWYESQHDLNYFFCSNRECEWSIVIFNFLGETRCRGQRGRLKMDLQTHSVWFRSWTWQVVATELSETPNYLTPHLVTLKAANDNLVEPEDLPLAPWF